MPFLSGASALAAATLALLVAASYTQRIPGPALWAGGALLILLGYLFPAIDQTGWMGVYPHGLMFGHLVVQGGLLLLLAGGDAFLGREPRWLTVGGLAVMSTFIAVAVFGLRPAQEYAIVIWSLALALPPAVLAASMLDAQDHERWPAAWVAIAWGVFAGFMVTRAIWVISVGAEPMQVPYAQWFPALAVCGLISLLTLVFRRVVPERGSLSLEGQQALLDTLEEAKAIDKARRDELLASREFRSRLYGVLAGQLQTPLGVIQSQAADIAARDAGNSHLAGNIAQTAEQLLTFVDDVVRYAAVDASSYSVREEPVHIETLVRDASEKWRLAATRKKQRMRVTLPDECGLVSGERAMLASAVEQLLSNAVKFSPIGGSIGVAVNTRREEIGIVVTDSGPGLSSNEREHLFTPFQTLSARPTGGESTAGLGLAAAQRIVVAHRGRILPDSEPGQGATFVIVLPRLDKPKLSAQA